MNNNKGFISMSLVYSFLIVFVAISISLLAVYTENITQIRRLNNEIKDELIQKGNERIIVFENLIQNGSFETLNGYTATQYWNITGTGCSVSSKDIHYESGVAVVGQAFYDKQSIEAAAGANCKVTSAQPISMKKDHIYYIERIYNSTLRYGDNRSQIKFVSGGTTITPNLPNFKPAKTINGWRMPTTGSDMGTVEVDLFKFSHNTGGYNIVMTFTDTTTTSPFYVDGLMLIDLTEAVGVSKANSYMASTATKDETARKVWRIKATKMGANGATAIYTTQGYYEGRKAFSALGPNSIK